MTNIDGQQQTTSDDDDVPVVIDGSGDIQNDDPSLFLAYQREEENDVDIVSLDDDTNGQDPEEVKKKIKYESEETNIKFHPLNKDGSNEFVIHAAPSNPPDGPRLFMHEGAGDGVTFNQTVDEEEQPRILVNVSIATDSGQGTKTHAVYSLHVMVPSGKDFFPPQPVVPCDCREAVELNFTRTLESLVEKPPVPSSNSTIQPDKVAANTDISCPILILEGEGVSFNI
jgi:hypothetical protein